jgi:ABC-type multidrug transport system fused ATPase/permease subunit
MQAGRVVEEGTHDKLFQSRGAYFELVKNQVSPSDGTTGVAPW